MTAGKFKIHKHKSPDLPQPESATVEVIVSTSEAGKISLEEFKKSTKHGHKAARALRLAWESDTQEKE